MPMIWPLGQRSDFVVTLRGMWVPSNRSCHASWAAIGARRRLFRAQGVDWGQARRLEGGQDPRGEAGGRGCPQRQ